MAAESSQLLTETEVADLLGVSVWWLRRSRHDRPEAIEAGTLPRFIKSANRVFYAIAEVEKIQRLRGERGLRRPWCESTGGRCRPAIF